MSAQDHIAWCQQQIDNAKDTLAGIAEGRRTWVNDEEINDKIATKATAIIAAMTALISAYSLLGR
jgi:hypothetical protein